MRISRLIGRMVAACLSCALIAALAVAGDEPAPPVEVPLAEIVDELAWGAARGEPEAACRLAMALAVCALDLPRSRVRPIFEPVGGDMEAFRDRVRQWTQAADRHEARLEAYCAGAPEVSMEVLMAAYRRAALLGSVEAMRLYAGANGDPLISREWQATGPEGAAWRTHALPVSWALLRAGDLGVAQRLWNEYLVGPDRVRPDPEKFPEGRFEFMDGLEEDPVKAHALLHYAIAVREAAIPEPDARELAYREDTQRWVGSIDEELTPAEHEQSRALVAEWMAAFERLPAQARADNVQSRYGWVRQPGSMPTCDQVAQAPQ